MTNAVFNALADETRRTIILRLVEGGPQTTGKLLDGLGMTRQGAARHLLTLEESGLVKSEKQGREIVRTLDMEAIRGTQAWMDELNRTWEKRMSRLAAQYEK